jgi:hypothetical protein
MKENKFFAVFGSIMAVGVIGLGFFLFKGWSDYKKQRAEYQETTDSVLLLKKKKLFPNAPHLELKKQQVADYVAKAEALQAKLLATQADLKPVRQEDFPNILLKTYEKTADFAKSKGIGLPENFYFGMEIYKDGRPPEQAVSLLEWQLDAINTLTNTLIEAGVSSVDTVKREPSALESKGSADEDSGKNARGKNNNKNAPGKNEIAGGVPYNPEAVMDAYRVEIITTGRYEALVEALNSISNNSNFFYWVRYMRVENEKKESPRRDDVFSPAPVAGQLIPPPPVAVVEPEPEPEPEAVPVDEGAAPVDPAAGDPAAVVVEQPAFVAPVAAPQFELAMMDVREIFGTEQTKAHLVIDLIRFKTPQVDETPSK